MMVGILTRGSSEGMAKINRDKILKAAVGSARLEGYKGSLKASAAKRVSTTSVKNKAKATAKN
jgi:hypothetical protein